MGSLKSTASYRQKKERSQQNKPSLAEQPSTWVGGDPRQCDGRWLWVCQEGRWVFWCFLSTWEGALWAFTLSRLYRRMLSCSSTEAYCELLQLLLCAWHYRWYPHLPNSRTCGGRAYTSSALFPLRTLINDLVAFFHSAAHIYNPIKGSWEAERPLFLTLFWPRWLLSGKRGRHVQGHLLCHSGCCFGFCYWKTFFIEDKKGDRLVLRDSSCSMGFLCISL